MSKCEYITSITVPKSPGERTANGCSIASSEQCSHTISSVGPIFFGLAVFIDAARSRVESVGLREQSQRAALPNVYGEFVATSLFTAA